MEQTRTTTKGKLQPGDVLVNPHLRNVMGTVRRVDKARARGYVVVALDSGSSVENDTLLGRADEQVLVRVDGR